MPTLNPNLPFRPYLLLLRRSLLWSGLLALLSAVSLLFWTSADSLTDVGVLWHDFCGCAPDPMDTFAILNVSSFTCAALGMLLGLSGTGLKAQNPGVPGGTTGVFGETRFLLTRPISRHAVLLIPVLIAGGTILLFPAAGLLLVTGWLYLVHAPALGHIVDLLHLVPSAAAPKDPSSLRAALAASHFTRHYVASVSIGLCTYALFHAMRWTIHSRNRYVRLSSAFASLLFTFPALGLIAPRLPPILFLTPDHHGDLGYVPSLFGIAAHFAFAAAILYGCWTIARDVEL